MIPESREGYALDQPQRVVHRRWAAHARGLPRVRGAREVTAWLGPEPSICVEGDCFPPATAPRPRASRPTHAEKMAEGRSTRKVVDVDITSREAAAAAQQSEAEAAGESSGADDAAADGAETATAETAADDAAPVEREPEAGLPEAASEEREA